MDRRLLNSMHHTADAGHYSGNRRGCLRGTRGDVLLQLEQWLKNEQDHRIFWLNGLAGTGKSTIAQTFAEISFADGMLGASFFCSRDFEGRNNLQAIFPTLAFQLAYRYPYSESSYSKFWGQILMSEASLFVLSWRKSLLAHSRQPKFQSLSSLMPLMSARMKSLHLPFFLSFPAMWKKYHR